MKDTQQTITDYQIAFDHSPEDLSDKVSYLVRSEGWQPYGPLKFDRDMIFQLLVKYEKE